jgi:hypothetical protein
MDELTRAELARLMGMKAGEVLAAEETDGGWLVTTHDQVVSYVTVDEATGRAFCTPYMVDGRLVSAVPVVQAESVAAGGDRAEDLQDLPPEGSEKQVLEWVGDDAERAAAALRMEQATGSPRKGLVAKLARIVEA